MSGGLPSFKEKQGAGEGFAGIKGGDKKVSDAFGKWYPDVAAWDVFAGLFPSPPEYPEFPEIKPATPPPTISETQEAGDEAARKMRRTRGRRGTFLTGDVVPELTPAKGKKKLLG